MSQDGYRDDDAESISSLSLSDDDIDEEEEIPEAKPKKKILVKQKDSKLKKNKIKKNQFVESEAEEATDEEESDYEKGYKREIHKKDDQKMKALLEKTSKRNIVEDLEKKYQNADEIDEQYDALEASDDFEDESNLPKIKDPKIWRVGCTRGKENESVMQLMFKYAQHKKANKMLQIISAFSVPKYPGVIFVEANFEHQVAEAIENFYFIRTFGIEPIDDEQYHTIFHTVEQEKIAVEAGEWVRVKQHQLYQGDLGRLLEVDEDKRVGIVKIIPREKRELASFSQNPQKKSKNQSGNHQVEDEVMIPEDQYKKHNKWYYRNQKLIESKKFVRGPKIRIQADKGDSDDNKMGDDKDERSAYFYSNLKEERERAKKDGFICLYTSLSNLVTKNFKPTEEELSYFFPDVKNIRSILKRYPSKFKLSAGQSDKIQVGDKVQDQTGRKYRVTKFLEDNKIEVRGLGQDQNNLLIMDGNQLNIAFAKYQQVKIVQGEHAGLQGTIISFNENVATITTDQQQIIYVQLNDLMTQRTVKGNDQQNNAQNFVQKIDQTSNQFTDSKSGGIIRHDLIRYGQLETEVGCILNIISEIYTVLDITNNKKDVPLKSILNKINTRNKVAKNKFKEEIHQSDLIVILEGFYKGCKAKVLHVYSDYVFLFGEKFDHTQGVIIEKVNNCALISSSSKTQIVQKSEDLQNLVGQYITIARGRWGGYRGLVMSIQLKTVTIQLTAKNLTVKVLKEEIGQQSETRVIQSGKTPHYAPQHSVRVWNDEENRNAQQGYLSPYVYAQTPMHDYPQ